MAEPRLPKVLYRVVRTSPGRKTYLATTGKTHGSLAYAKGRKAEIEFEGGTAEIYVCQPQWRKLEEEPSDG